GAGGNARPAQPPALAVDRSDHALAGDGLEPARYRRRRHAREGTCDGMAAVALERRRDAQYLLLRIAGKRLDAHQRRLAVTERPGLVEHRVGGLGEPVERV